MLQTSDYIDVLIADTMSFGWLKPFIYHLLLQMVVKHWQPYRPCTYHSEESFRERSNLLHVRFPTVLYNFKTGIETRTKTHNTLTSNSTPREFRKSISISESFLVRAPKDSRSKENPTAKASARNLNDPRISTWTGTPPALMDPVKR